MELTEIAKKINENILLLARTRDMLKKRAIVRAKTIAEYEKEVAKTVMIKIDGKMAMVVLPASYVVDFDLLKKVTGSQDIVLASEGEFQNLFPDCEVGAMPPFGNLYQMPVFVAQSLAEDEEIAFNAGSHRELIKLLYKDFNKMVNPEVIKFSLKKD